MSESDKHVHTHGVSAESLLVMLGAVLLLLWFDEVVYASCVLGPAAVLRSTTDTPIAHYQTVPQLPGRRMHSLGEEAVVALHVLLELLVEEVDDRQCGRHLTHDEGC